LPLQAIATARVRLDLSPRRSNGAPSAPAKQQEHGLIATFSEDEAQPE
jgi:hypothetical protein